MNLRQRTISREVALDGPGLFSGEPATLTFAPAEADSGITFVREQDGIPCRQRTRDSDSLLLPAAELVWEVPGPRREIDVL